MTILLAIEGADGVGKNTTATRLVETLNAAGRRATLLSFPRYSETAGGAVLGQYLAGKLPVEVTPQAAAVLYALDRFESRQLVLDAAAANEVVVFDRYIASNMAYQAARVARDEGRPLMEWIATLETAQFELPPPTRSIYLDTPWEIARELILRKRQRSYTDRSYDEYEADVALQLAVRGNYEAMTALGLLGPWSIVRTSSDGAMRSTDAIVAEIIALL